MEHPTYGNGKICYLEISAKDVKASAAFYEQIFGWKIRTRGDDSIAFDDAVEEVSGTFITGREPHNDKGLSVHLMVSDMRATLQQITANGGKIIEDMNDQASEKTAKFSDPAGNIFGLYQHL
jgi:predicted enzyme related to lactoylglutathione lyase